MSQTNDDVTQIPLPVTDPKSHLAAIVDSSDDAIISKTLDGIIRSWNKAAEKLFGYTADEAIGKHITLIIPEERHDEEFVILGKIKEGRRVDHFETIRRRKDGQPIQLSLTVSPIKDAKGQIVGASKIARDITESKRIEQELRETGQRKDEFIANISHELRTPMNAVVGLANILSLSTALPEKEKKYVETLKESAEGLLTLINNLLDYSRLDNGLMEVEEIEFDLPAIVERVGTLLKVKLEEKQIAYNVAYEPGLRQYYIGDAFKIQQVLINLVSNAVKFTEEGTVNVSFRCDQQNCDGCILTIEVADSGIGIPEDKLPLIFDKFVQADSSITRKYGGSGLGLAITKGFIEVMGGTIAVQSKPDLGTIFTVNIPVKHCAKEALIAEARAADIDDKKKNVLIVDDYEPNVVVISAVLDQLGYSYDVADDGLEAVRLFQAKRYDVVLMDVQMHDMDGFESTKRMREAEAERKLPHTPIIAMTAHVQEKDKNQCLAAGMDDFVPKPFELAFLAEKLKPLIKA